MIREIWLNYHQLDPLQLFEVIRKFEDWVKINFTHLELPPSKLDDTEKEHDEFDMSVDDSVPIIPLPLPKEKKNLQQI